MGTVGNAAHREPWNKGKIVGQKAPFKLKDIWALRVRLQMEGRVRELALFNLGIDSKLRGCDLVALRVRDVCHGDQVATARHRHAAQDSAPGPVRDHAGHSRRPAGVDQVAALKPDDFCFPADFTTHLIWAPGSTRGSSGTGLTSLGLIVPTTARTRCAGPRRR
jgi:hypothetical protein